MNELSEPAIVIRLLAQALVNSPDSIVVREISGSGATVIEIHTAPGETGQIIGKRGRTADALRELLGSMAGRAHRRYILEIVETRTR